MAGPNIYGRHRGTQGRTGCLATLRADAKDDEGLLPLRQVAKVLVTEATVQEILRNRRLDTEQARDLARTTVRYVTDL